jgi:hypothetical protein
MTFYWKDVSTYRDHFHLVRCPIPLFLKDVIGCHYYTHYINFFTSKLRVKDDRSTYVACMRLFWIKQLVCSMNKKSYTIVCMKLILVKLITCGLPWTLPLFPSTMNVLYKFPLMWEKFTCLLILTNKVCAAVLLLWVMEAMFNRILFCCNGHQGMVLRFVEIVTRPPRVQCRKTICM